MSNELKPRTLTIKVERELVMLCAEQANREKVSTLVWINARLRKAVEEAVRSA